MSEKIVKRTLTNIQLLVTFYGEEINEKALRNLVLVNHQFYCDWLVGFVLGYRTNKHGYLKIVMKKSIEYIPGVGKHLE